MSVPQFKQLIDAPTSFTRDDSMEVSSDGHLCSGRKGGTKGPRNVSVRRMKLRKEAICSVRTSLSTEPH
eukprot:5282514-Prymnesium_polylepis.4